jgi:type II secretory pathway component PulF
MNAETLIALNEEIAGMARAGLPLDQGLAAIAREMGKGRLRQVTAAIAKDLQSGQTLPQALERQSGRMPPFYAGLVAAGIRTGRISEVLATLTTYARSVINLRTIVLDAIFYPSVILLFSVGLFAFVTLFILPQFDLIFRDFQMSLPLITEWMLAVGRYPIETVLAPALGLIVAFIVAKLSFRWTEQGRRRWARFIYFIPVIGTLIRSARLAAFADLMAILVDNELPLPEAFRLAGQSSTEPIMAAATRQIEEDLQQGLPLGKALRGRGLIPDWVSWMIGLAERRGSLAKTLHQIAETYRRQVEVRAAMLRSVLPPFLIIGTAGMFTCLFAFGVMLPMIKLLEGLSRF